jgi:hypothetical protein
MEQQQHIMSASNAHTSSRAVRGTNGGAETPARTRCSHAQRPTRPARTAKPTLPRSSVRLQTTTHPSPLPNKRIKPTRPDRPASGTEDTASAAATATATAAPGWTRSPGPLGERVPPLPRAALRPATPHLVCHFVRILQRQNACGGRLHDRDVVVGVVAHRHAHA